MSVGAGVALKLLETADEDLEVTARKVKRLFRVGVEQAARDGTCSESLWVFLRTFGLVFKADVQALEGVNSMIKSINGRCPNLSLALLDARLRSRKHMVLEGSLWLLRGRAGGRWPTRLQSKPCVQTQNRN